MIVIGWGLQPRGSTEEGSWATHETSSRGLGPSRDPGLDVVDPGGEASGWAGDPAEGRPELNSWAVRI